MSPAGMHAQLAHWWGLTSQSLAIAVYRKTVGLPRAVIYGLSWKTGIHSSFKSVFYIAYMCTQITKCIWICSSEQWRPEAGEEWTHQ